MEFGDTEACPLTPAMVELLQAAADHQTVRNMELARALLVTAEMVHARFSQICTRLGVHSRAAAVLAAVEHGWVTQPTPAEAPLSPAEAGGSAEPAAADRAEDRPETASGAPPGPTGAGDKREPSRPDRKAGQQPNARRPAPNPYRGSGKRRRLS